jgi:L-2-hydroxyglutarate oxidase LhgO
LIFQAQINGITGNKDFFYRAASKLHKGDEDIQVATLIYTMGKEADNLLKSFELSESNSKKYGTV